MLFAGAVGLLLATSLTQMMPAPPSEVNESQSSDSVKAEEVPPNVCPICLEEFNFDTQKMLICNHRYHLSCIKKWHNTKSNCPACRLPFQWNHLPPSTDEPGFVRPEAPKKPSASGFNEPGSSMEGARLRSSPAPPLPHQDVLGTPPEFDDGLTFLIRDQSSGQYDVLRYGGL